MIPTWSVQTRKIEDAIWQRQEAFEKRFCRGEELLSVWFNEEYIKVVYLVPTGATWTDEFPMVDFIDFISQNPV